MKKIFIICILCVGCIIDMWGQSNNNTTYTLFPSVSGNRITVPGDFSESESMQFSATLTWNGETVTVPPASADAMCRFQVTGGYLVLRVTLQRFKSGIIPLQATNPERSVVIINIVYPDGTTVSKDVPRTTAATVQAENIDITPENS